MVATALQNQDYVQTILIQIIESITGILAVSPKAFFQKTKHVTKNGM